jgi:predicted dehydrogenase
MRNVRFGIIGIGNMGSNHAKHFVEGRVQGATLTAVCDENAERLQWAKDHLGEEVKTFSHVDDMFASKSVDAVLIATPHYDHPTIAIKAFEQNLHVLIEKPAGVYTKNVRIMNEAAIASGKVFSIMYQMRLNPLYQKIRDLILSGELGEIRRTNWIITNWYRSQSYYDSGTWRATWEGEGGGVLLNQDPHQLDLLQWMTGMMPKRLRAFCHFGKWRNIQVEDDVTAYMEYDNGATGVFVTTTGDAPGTNRFEVAGDRGKIVMEEDTLTLWRLRTPESEFNATYKGGFGGPECWKSEIPIVGNNPDHLGIIQNFIDAINKGIRLEAPGEEGIKGLSISNAMHLSTWIDNWVYLPINEDLYYEHLQSVIKQSSGIQKSSDNQLLDVDGTH